MSRIFRKVNGELRSALAEDQIDTPVATIGVFLDDEQLMRLFYRVYQLGRKDKAAELRSAFHEY